MNLRRAKLIDAALAIVAALKIEVPRIDARELRRQALEHYELLWSERGRYEKLSRGERTDSAFVARVTVNYLRHQLSSYEAEMDQVKGTVGAAEARAYIRSRVLDAIVSTYPELADEVASQRRQTFSE